MLQIMVLSSVVLLVLGYGMVLRSGTRGSFSPLSQWRQYQHKKDLLTLNQDIESVAFKLQSLAVKHYME